MRKPPSDTLQPHELVRLHGSDPIDVSTLQPGMEVVETSFGFWAYRRAAGMEITLGGPVCAAGDRPALLERLRATCRRPLLFYVSEAHLRDLKLWDAAPREFHTASIGTDREADLPALLRAPTGPVASAVRKARHAGFAVAPVPWSAVDSALRSRLEAITRRYLDHAQVQREMSFINRPMSFEDNSLRRLFVLRLREDVFGYAVLNAVFSGGAPRGYLLDILRFEPVRLWGVWLATVFALAERLAREGLTLSLGFCPLHAMVHPPSRSRALSLQLDALAQLVSSAQYIRRLRELKSLVPGHSGGRYIASFTRVAPAVLVAFMEALGVGIGTLWGPDLVRVLARGLGGRAVTS